MDHIVWTIQYGPEKHDTYENSKNFSFKFSGLHGYFEQITYRVNFQIFHKNFVSYFEHLHSKNGNSG